jgi:hypothetical protein
MLKGTRYYPIDIRCDDPSKQADILLAEIAAAAAENSLRRFNMMGVRIHGSRARLGKSLTQGGKLGGREVRTCWKGAG